MAALTPWFRLGEGRQLVAMRHGMPHNCCNAAASALLLSLQERGDGGAGQFSWGLRQ